MKQQEDLQLLGVIDGSVKAAMEALGDELIRYLKEAGEEIEEKKKEEKEAKKTGLASILEGFARTFSSPKPKHKAPKKRSQTDLMRETIARENAIASLNKVMWNTYHHFKKHHDMLNW